MLTANEDNIKIFYDSSDRYLEICESRSEENFKNILDVVQQYVPKNASLLEFGCGTGNLAALIADKDYKVLGVDISDRFVEHAKGMYQSSRGNLAFETVGFGKLPYADESFDCIYTCAVLEHCYKVDEIIMDFHRILKKGGTLIIGTPNMLSPFTRVLLIAKTWMGKRSRYHLYGTPSFLMKSIWYNIKKIYSRKPDLIYVTPKYDGFNESDEDVTYLSTHKDYLRLLKPLNYKIHELARGESKGGKIIAKLFPKLSGEVLIVAAKHAPLAGFGVLTGVI
jgi:2-polyprenyl-3-methyl-5-hydroxy-6-metoxy-1,4-benzoquinol methylase